MDLYTGALFIQQSLGWDLYISILGLIVVVAVLTITGQCGVLVLEWRLSRCYDQRYLRTPLSLFHLTLFLSRGRWGDVTTTCCCIGVFPTVPRFCVKTLKIFNGIFQRVVLYCTCISPWRSTCFVRLHVIRCNDGWMFSCMHAASQALLSTLKNPFENTLSLCCKNDELSRSDVILRKIELF